MAAENRLGFPGRDTETHSRANEHVRDVVIGMSDGLTVPFALAAGIAGAGAHTALIITAGLAEIAAGSISMGLGGYLAARGEADHYANERRREEQEVAEKPQVEMQEVTDILTNYGLTPEESRPVVSALARREKDWVDFMMQFELGLERPDPHRALVSALTIAGAYIVGGFIPLSPYMFIPDAGRALIVSVIVTGIALLGFGYLRGRFTTDHPLRSTIQTLIIGGLAAAAAFFMAKLV